MPAEVTQNGPAGTEQQNAATQNDDPPSREATAGGRENEEHPVSRDSDPGSRSANDAIMDHLDIPEEVRKQIRPKGEAAHTKDAKAAKVADGGPAGEEEEGKSGSQEGQEEEGLKPENEKAEDQEHDGEEEEEGADAPAILKNLDPKIRKKLEKRFGRLTRKNQRLEETLDTALQELDGFRTQAGAEAQRAATAGPKGQGALGTIRSEGELDDAITQAKAVRKLVADNPDGLQVGDGAAAKFYSPDDLRKWDLNAQEILLDSEPRRRELREFQANRSAYDTEARKEFPKIFDKESREFQAAVAIVQRYPWIRELPEANYAVGVMLEGFAALEARKAGGQRSEVRGQNGNGNGANGRKRDIDERVFAPRVPLAPHTAGPGNRQSLSLSNPNGAPSEKRVDKAKQELLADPDGSAESLARVFAAIDARES